MIYKKSNQHQLLVYYLFLVIFFISSCRFQSDKEFFEEIEPASLEEIEGTLKKEYYNLKNFSNDTIGVFRETEFTFETDTNDKDINIINVYLEGRLLRSSRSKSFDFEFDPEDYDDEFYNLKIDIITHSGSGSLADKAGAELFKTTLEWVISIDRTAPNEIAVTNLVEENGALKINWEKYNRFNFRQYEIHREVIYSEKNNDTYTTIVGLIDDKNITSFVDSSFIQGKARYRVKVSSYTGETYGAYSQFLDIPLASPLKAQSSYDGSMRLSWGKPKLYGAFREYQIVDRSQKSYPIIFSSSDINDTTFVYKPPQVLIGAEIEIWLTMVNQRNRYHESSTQKILEKHGQKSDFYSSLISSKKHNSIYQILTHPDSASGWIVRSDGSEFIKKDSVNWSSFNNSDNDQAHEIILSEDYEKLYYLNMGTLIELDPIDLSIIQEYDMEEMTGSTNLHTYEIEVQITSNGLIKFYNPNGVQVFNLRSGQPIFKDYLKGTLDRPQISVNGNFLKNGGSIYLLQNGQYIEYATFPIGRYNSAFFDQKEENVFLTGYGESQLYDLNTKATLNLYSDRTSGQDRIAYDDMCECLYFEKGRNHFLTVYNMISHEFNDIQISSKKYYRNNYLDSYNIVGDYIFWEEGKYLKWK